MRSRRSTLSMLDDILHNVSLDVHTHLVLVHKQIRATQTKYVLNKLRKISLKFRGRSCRVIHKKHPLTIDEKFLKEYTG